MNLAEAQKRLGLVIGEDFDGEAGILFDNIASLIAHYKLDDDAASTLITDEINGYNGDLDVNTDTRSAAGKLGKCIDFNGSSNFIDCKDIAAWDWTNELTVECFAKFITGVSNWPLISKEFYLARESDGKIIFSVTGNGADYTYVRTDGTYALDAWTLVKGAYNGATGTLKIYINGVEVAQTVTGSVPATLYNGSQTLKIGKWGSDYYKGYIDNVRIYTKCLNPTTAKALWNSGDGTEANSSSSLAGLSDDFIPEIAGGGAMEIVSGTLIIDTSGSKEEQAILVSRNPLPIGDARDIFATSKVKTNVISELGSATVGRGLSIYQKATRPTVNDIGSSRLAWNVWQNHTVSILYMRHNSISYYYNETSDIWQTGGDWHTITENVYYIVEAEKNCDTLANTWIVREKNAAGTLIYDTPQTDKLLNNANPHWLVIGEMKTDEECTMVQTFDYIKFYAYSKEELLRKSTFFPYRKVEIKRRQNDGTYETDWFDVTDYVKEIGDIDEQLDDIALNKYRMGTMDVIFKNSSGELNDKGYEGSLFNGFLTPYMTKVKIEYGLGVDESLMIIVPEERGTFYGLLIDDIQRNADEATATFNSFLWILENQSAEDLTLLATDTASDIIGKIRDLQINGESVFDRFIDTWNIATTTAVYTDITAANALAGMSCWDLIQKLAEAENMIAYMGKDGSFNFAEKSLGDFTFPDNMMLHYKLNDSGYTVIDSSSEENDGTLQKTEANYFHYWSSSPDAKINLALKAGYFWYYFPPPADLTVKANTYGKTDGDCKFMSSGDANNWSIEFWGKIAKHSSSTGDEGNFLYRGSDTVSPYVTLDSDGDFRVFYDKNGSLFDLKISLYDSSLHTYTLSSEAAERLSEDVFCHIEIEYNGTTLVCKLDDTEIFSQAISLTFDDSSNTRGICFTQPFKPTSQSAPQTGENQIVMDILRIYADVLTADENTSLYNLGLGTEAGIFTADTSHPAYKFYGNIFNDGYGSNIKEITDFSNGWANIFNRIQCEYAADTFTTAKEDWTPGDGGSTDKYGQRIYKFQNYWMTLAEAEVAVLDIFNQNSSPAIRMTIKAPIIPGLGLMDIVYVDSGSYMGMSYAFFGVITGIGTSLQSLEAEYTIKELL